VAFNVEIDAPLATAKQIARELRTTLDVRALGLQADRVQVSTNIEDHTKTTAAQVVAAVRKHARVVEGVRVAIARIDLTRHEGVHPRVGALDVAPIVYLDEAQRGAAIAEALVLADELGELGLPVYLYGELAGGRTRAELRRPGALDGLQPDFGPPAHPTAGATLVAARRPLIAFNVEVDAPLETAREIARGLRNDHVKALGLRLESTGVVQVSTNIEDHTRTTMADVVAMVREHATVTGAELVAPAPRAAHKDFPEDVPLRGPAPLEDHLSS